MRRSAAATIDVELPEQRLENMLVMGGDGRELLRIQVHALTPELGRLGAERGDLIGAPLRIILAARKAHVTTLRLTVAGLPARGDYEGGAGLMVRGRDERLEMT